MYFVIYFCRSQQNGVLTNEAKTEKLNNILDKIKKNNNTTNVNNIASNSVNNPTNNSKNFKLDIVSVGSSNGTSNKANINSTHCKIQAINSNGASTSCRLVFWILSHQIWLFVKVYFCSFVFDLLLSAFKFKA